jgi:hypothetical protein
LKRIETLTADIKARLNREQPWEIEEEDIRSFGHKIGQYLVERLTRAPDKPSLRVSNFGSPCGRKLWYSINSPELAEPLSPSTRLKFLLGDLWEYVLLFLAKASGHTVEHEQAEVNLHGVLGHIDSVIDGELCDVKSASSYSFQKFKEGRLAGEDPFGYTTQLNSYLHSLPPELLRNTERAHFLVGDKTLGHLTLDTHPRKDVDYEQEVAQKREMLAWPRPPARGYSDIPEGKSGNRRLGMECSYCAFKQTCWPTLRVFNYAGRPKFLTQVIREPDVQEISIQEAAAED